MAKEQDKLTITRRDALIGGGAAALLAVEPAAALALPEPGLRGPPGQDRKAPGFRPVSFDK